MTKSKMEPVGYEQGLQDMRDYVVNSIRNAIDNPALDTLPSRMVLQILIASFSNPEID